MNRTPSSNGIEWKYKQWLENGQQGIYNEIKLVKGLKATTESSTC